MAEKTISRRGFLDILKFALGGFALTACGVDPDKIKINDNNSKEEPINSDVTPELAMMAVKGQEVELQQKILRDTIKYDVLSDEERNVLFSKINGIINGSGEVRQTIIDGTENVAGIAAPMLQLTNESTIRSLSTVIQGVETSVVVNYVNLFHWTNHASEAGMDVYEMAKYSKYLSEIVRGAMSGNGAILYRPETTTTTGKQLQEAYYFFSKVNGQDWVTILSPNGAPITGFNSGMKAGEFSQKEALRYFSSQLKIASQITDIESIPNQIKNNWIDKTNPPLLRMWAWALKYQSELLMAGAGIKATEAVKIITDSMLLKLPLIVFPVDLMCTSSVGGLPKLDFCPPEDNQA